MLQDEQKRSEVLRAELEAAASSLDTARDEAVATVKREQFKLDRVGHQTEAAYANLTLRIQRFLIATLEAEIQMRADKENNTDPFHKKHKPKTNVKQSTRLQYALDDANFHIKLGPLPSCTSQATKSIPATIVRNIYVFLENYVLSPYRTRPRAYHDMNS